MPDWIATARNSLRRDMVATGPAPFERVCLCGERLRGEREESPHSIICGRCQRSWFVLPRDPYPWPKSQRKRRRSSPRRKKSRPKKREQAAPSAPATVPTPRETQSDADETSAETTTKPVPVPMADSSWPERLRRPWREGRSRGGTRPVRLVVGGILLLFLITGVWLWHRARVREAAATLVAAVPAAEKAIDHENLPLAAERMAQAAYALDILDAQDATARRIRQRNRELVAITHLASLGLYDLAAEAEAANDPGRWTRRFANLTAGRWVILDAPLGAARPATTNQPRNSETEDEEENSDDSSAIAAEMVIPLKIPLTVGNRPVRFELEAGRFEKLSPLGRGIIAAQYASWRQMTDASGAAVWVVRFHPETAFAWTSPDLLEAAGFDLDDPFLSARGQLAKQAEVLGIPAESASNPAGERKLAEKLEQKNGNRKD